MRTLILGGVRSGKSRLGEQYALASGLQVVYVATTVPEGDVELQERVRQHRARRPSTWLTIEEPFELGQVLRANASPERCLLVECLTLWLTNLLCERPDQLESERDSFCEALTHVTGELILVGNETGLGVVPLGTLSRRFVDVSGELHQKLAVLCERVSLTVAGLAIDLKSPVSASAINADFD